MQNLARSSPAQPLQRPAGAFTAPARQGLRVPQRSDVVRQAMRHDFGTGLNVPPQYTHSAALQLRPQPQIPTPPVQQFQPRPQAGIVPPQVPHRPVHHSVPFWAALIGAGVSLATLGAYLGVQAFQGEPAVHAQAALSR